MLAELEDDTAASDRAKTPVPESLNSLDLDGDGVYEHLESLTPENKDIKDVSETLNKNELEIHSAVTANENDHGEFLSNGDSTLLKDISHPHVDRNEAEEKSHIAAVCSTDNITKDNVNAGNDSTADCTTENIVDLAHEENVSEVVIVGDIVSQVDLSRPLEKKEVVNVDNTDNVECLPRGESVGVSDAECNNTGAADGDIIEDIADVAADSNEDNFVQAEQNNEEPRLECPAPLPSPSDPVGLVENVEEASKNVVREEISREVSQNDDGVERTEVITESEHSLHPAAEADDIKENIHFEGSKTIPAAREFIEKVLDQLEDNVAETTDSLPDLEEVNHEPHEVQSEENSTSILDASLPPPPADLLSPATSSEPVFAPEDTPDCDLPPPSPLTEAEFPEPPSDTDLELPAAPEEYDLPPPPANPPQWHDNSDQASGNGANDKCPVEVTQSVDKTEDEELPPPPPSLLMSKCKPTAVVKPCNLAAEVISADNKCGHAGQRQAEILDKLQQPSHNQFNEKIVQQASSEHCDGGDNIISEDSEVKNVITKTCDIIESSNETEEVMMETEDSEEIVPPSKGYNLDFLDNLDDPNFNPFETKSGVTVCFSESAPVAQAQAFPQTSIAVTSEETKDLPSTEDAQPQKKPLPKKPWLKSKKKAATGEETDKTEKTKKVPSKPLPPKPWLKKKSAVPADEAPKAEEVETNIEEEEIKVPSKGYNLDFLDNLDDPNLNPFETKTAIVDKFDNNTAEKTSDDTVNVCLPAASSSDLKTAKSETPSDVQDVNEIKTSTKEVPPKPWLKKKTKKPVVPKVQENVEVAQDEDEVKVPSKGYNLDFLDNLDDPNFNPFETKSSVENKFEDSAPVQIKEDIKEIKEDPVIEEKKEDIVPKKKKQMPEKPWLKAKKNAQKEATMSEDVAEEKVPSKGYNLDFLDNLEDPNFNPFETKTSVVENFEEQKEPSESHVTPDVDNIETPVESVLPQPPPETSESQDDHIEAEEVKTTPGGYNLDFLDKLDDPNFNPFETKSQINDKDTEPAEATESPESGSDTTLVLETVNNTETETEAETVMEPSVETVDTEDSTPELEQQEAELEQPPLRPESPLSNSSGYSSIPPAQEMSFVLPEPVNIAELLAGHEMEQDTTVTDVTITDFLTPGKAGAGPSQAEELGQLAKMGLLHEERLLQKDKEVSRLNAVVRQQQAEVDQLRIQLEMKSDNNNQMMVIVDEFEKTIQQLIQEKERGQVSIVSRGS